MTDVPEQFIPDAPAVLDSFDHPFIRRGFDRIDSADTIDCPDCGATMEFAKKLQTEPMDSDARFTAYRCDHCTAIDIVAESDGVEMLDEMRGIMEAVHMRGRNK